MTQISPLTFEKAQTLRKQAFDLEQALFCLYEEQSVITLAAVPYKARWQTEFERLQKIIRIWTKSYARLERRRKLIERSYL
jgi:hypothetical protein